MVQSSTLINRRPNSTHLNQRMPVGHGFAWIGEHLVPVLSAQGVGVVADTTHSDDLIMAHAAGAGEDVLSAAASLSR